MLYRLFRAAGRALSPFFLDIVNIVEVKMTKIEKHVRGELCTIGVADSFIDVLYLFHALDRINKWNITREMVAETLIFPQEVTIGHRNRYIAHRKYESHVVRAVYEYERKLPVLVTTYFPNAKRYFKGGGIYEDKIFQGS